MTWDEAKKVFPKYDFVALVTGSHEQHSLHLPLMTDSIIGEYFGKRLAEEAERRAGIKILLLPTLWLGYSGEHTNFPGTVTVDPKTLENVLLDIAVSLKRHGAGRFLIINSHGGNVPVVQVAVDRIERQVGLQSHLLHWTIFGNYPRKAERKVRPEPLRLNHSGMIETAMMLRVNPKLVNHKKFKIPKLNPLMLTRGWWGARYWEEVSDTGASDDPHNATLSQAESFFSRAIDNSIYALRRDLNLERGNHQSKSKSRRPKKRSRF